MGWVKDMVKGWLDLKPASDSSITIQEPLSFDGTVARNRILYRGDPSEIEQFFQSTKTSEDVVSLARFWASVPTRGMQIRKIHSGLPAMIVNVLADIVVGDMLDVEVTSPEGAEETWSQIADENDLKELVTGAVQEVLSVGDGAFKISFDTELSQLPILEFYSGDRVGYELNRGRVKAVHFKTTLKDDKDRAYTLIEKYGIGYVNYELYDRNDKPVNLSTLPETKGLRNATWADKYMLAVPLMIYKSPKWPGRGRSIFDLKLDNFDALDETISQWQDAIRLGRIKRYIPQEFIPRDPDTGNVLPVSPFDNQFMAIRGSAKEGAENKIVTDQPNVNYEGFVTTYVNNLDLCLQGLVSPSTLGIDTKKLDNAEAQREKEKTTLYTRGKIISVLTKVLEELVNATLKGYATFQTRKPEDIVCSVEFGEYANPSFEAQVETVGKAATSQIMSIETQVDTLYGDTKDEEWKKAEVSRIKNEKGIAEVQEPSFVPNGFKEVTDGPAADTSDLPGDGAVSDGLSGKDAKAPQSVGSGRGV